MAYWIFKFNPKKYRFMDRVRDEANLATTWRVTEFGGQIKPGDIAFIWETGKNSGIRGVLRVESAVKDLAELEHEKKFCVDLDTAVRPRVLATITKHGLSLSSDSLRSFPDLEMLPVFHGMQQGTNFPVNDKEGAFLEKLIVEKTAK